MSQLEMGVLIHAMGGNAESVETWTAAMGKTIVDLRLVPDTDALYFTFDDGSQMKVYDDGQSCCETRYMTTDDPLADFFGATLTGAELLDGPTTDGEWGEPHETQFLRIKTSVGDFTMVNHNEHNGYYGGFRVIAEPVEYEIAPA